MRPFARMTILMAGLGLPFAAAADVAQLTKPNLVRRQIIRDIRGVFRLEALAHP
jgi:hypothetical protein